MFLFRHSFLITISLITLICCGELFSRPTFEQIFFEKNAPLTDQQNTLIDWRFSPTVQKIIKMHEIKQLPEDFSIDPRDLSITVHNVSDQTVTSYYLSGARIHLNSKTQEHQVYDVFSGTTLVLSQRKLLSLKLSSGYKEQADGYFTIVKLLKSKTIPAFRLWYNEKNNHIQTVTYHHLADGRIISLFQDGSVKIDFYGMNEQDNPITNIIDKEDDKKLHVPDGTLVQKLPHYKKSFTNEELGLSIMQAGYTAQITAPETFSHKIQSKKAGKKVVITQESEELVKKIFTAHLDLNTALFSHSFFAPDNLSYALYRFKFDFEEKQPYFHITYRPICTGNTTSSQFFNQTIESLSQEIKSKIKIQ